MHRQSFIHCAILSGAFTFFMGMLMSSAYAADPSPNTPVPSAIIAEGNALASGSIEDSLKACLARIPNDATTGQRMIAEQGCRRDEADRKPIQAVPGR
ncbi:MAG TPA: hypothetical protein VI359_00190 [Nitrospiraceae bacterium]